ncbi:hypothetical protein E7X38_09075 [Streptomyces sp. Akac8]|nr:hypothetical protein E7X38_09075 [Streptomyces sp. Akac8]
MSGVWCVQLQGGGGSRRGASASDDNAADGRARPRVLGVIRRTGPRGTESAGVRAGTGQFPTPSVDMKAAG